MRRASPLMLLFALLGLTFACAAREPAADPGARPGRLVTLPDGRKINFRCSGTGAPTVILESGYSATSLAWYKVQPLVAQHHRVCAYDRAGYGFSDEGPAPRDGAATARDLDQALRAGGIRGPYIMVGHSAGGLYARLFAYRRPADVVGLVLADTSVEHQEARFNQQFGMTGSGASGLVAKARRCLDAAQRGVLPSTDKALESCTPKRRNNQSEADFAARMAEALRPGQWRTQASEAETLWTSTSDAIDRGPPSFGDLPMIVLTADGTYDSAPEPARAPLAAFWARLHAEVAARSLQGQQRTVADSSHMMILDQPQAIADAVAEVAARAKARGR